MATPSNAYSNARAEFIEALFNNEKALDTLQKMYKLPGTYSSLNPARTVRALETLGVFSPENPQGLIELPHWLDMKETQKKIKKILKVKKGTEFRFKGCTDLHMTTDLKRDILPTIQQSGRYFQAEVELLKCILETRAAHGGGNAAIRVIPLITDLVKDVQNSMSALKRLATELYSTDSDHDSLPLKLVETKPSGGGSDPLRRRPLPMQPDSPHPLHHNEQQRVIEREAAIRKQQADPRLVPVVLADDNPYQIFPPRDGIDSGSGSGDRSGIRYSRTFDHLSLDRRPNRAETSPPQYDDLVPSRRPLPIPPLQYDDIVHNRPIPATAVPLIPPRAGQPEPHRQQQQPVVTITQPNPFQPRQFLTAEQDQFQRQNAHGQSIHETNTQHRRPPPIPAPYNSSLSTPPLPPRSNDRSDTLSSISSAGYVDMHPAGSVNLLKDTNNSTSSVQSIDRYQHLRHSRMDSRDSYVNMTRTLDINETFEVKKKDASYVNINPVIDSLRSNEDTESAGEIQEEYDTFSTSSATNPFYSNRY